MKSELMNWRSSLLKYTETYSRYNCLEAIFRMKA